MNILVLDDEALIGFDLQDLLESDGHTVVGPCMTQDEAISEISASIIDFALLDVNLGRGKDSSPVAEELARRKIPFAFLTGYNASEVDIFHKFPQARRVGKPFDEYEVRDLLVA